jgi:membrane-bound lytic murein transglycosylase D
MNPTRINAVVRRSLLPCALTLLALTLGGCSSNRSRDLMLPEQPRSVSAREYGFVRPALDPQTLLAATGSPASQSSLAAIASTGDPWQRIRHGQSLGIPTHPRVEKSLQQLTRKKTYFKELAGRAGPYLDLILAELERNGLPGELALLPEIESRYNPRAVSHMSAAGMWQFMPYTGKRMGLAQTSSYDGRHDVVASTRAAMKYLRELNQLFDGDWALTLAAYNAGPGRVQAAQRNNEKAGKPTDYWSLKLPQETQDYVPKLLAVVAVARNPQGYGQRTPRRHATPPLAMVTTKQPIDLTTAATASGLPAETLKNLNPGFKQGRNPGGQSVTLLVPSQAVAPLQRHLRELGAKTAALAASAQAPGGRS